MVSSGKTVFELQSKVERSAEIYLRRTALLGSSFRPLLYRAAALSQLPAESIGFLLWSVYHLAY